MFNKYPIFKRTLLNQLSSKVNIILFIIFIPLFLASIIFGIWTANLIFFGWVAFACLILFVTFFNIFFIVSSFNRDLELGVMNLEIRSGYKNSKLFFQRLLAQKAYILPVEIILFLIWFLIGNFSGVSFIKIATFELMFGMMAIFLYEIFISSFLLLFASFKSGITTTFFGVLLGILLTVMPLFSLLDAYVNSLGTISDKEYSKFTLQKFAFIDEFDKIKNENANGHIDSQVSVNLNNKNKTSDFFEAFTVFDSFFKDEVRTESVVKDVWNVKQRNDRENGKYSDEYRPEHTYTFVSRQYVNDLFYNGLAPELINSILPLYNSEGEHKFSDYIQSHETEKASYDAMKENNSVMSFIKQIDDVDISFSKNMKPNLKNSFFTIDAKTNNRYSIEDGFDNFTNQLKKSFNKDKEMLRIIDLVNEVAKFSYVSAYKTNSMRSSVFDLGGSNDDNIKKSVDYLNLWLGNTKKDINTQEWLNVSSDGARVFFKIYFDLLREYMLNPTPIYNISNFDNQYVNANEYLNKIKLKNIINPGVMLSSLFYNSGTNKRFQNSQNDFFVPYLANVYDFDESIKNENNLIQYLNIEKNKSGVPFIKWDINENVIPDNNAFDNENWFLDQLKKVILNNPNDDLKSTDLDFKYITKDFGFSEESSIFSGLQVFTTNDKYFGEQQFYIQFMKGDKPTKLTLAQNDKILKSIDIDKTNENNSWKIINEINSPKSDLYKFGKKDGQLIYIGSTVNVYLPIMIFIISSVVLLAIAWMIFNKKIVN